MTEIERFWSKVEKTETCWLWKAGISDGFGQFMVSWKPTTMMLAHRYSYQLHFGSVPIDKRVEQTCHNKLCVNPSHLLVRSEQDRFWSFVQKLSDGCWDWIGAFDEDMYGLFRLDRHGKQIRATHYSWLLHVGRPVPKRIHVCHTCDHPYCVNPEHLFLGTNQDNTADRHAKGRDACGIKHGKARLTEDNVLFIRQSNLSHAALGRMFHVSASTIAKIRKRLLWKSIPD